MEEEEAWRFPTQGYYDQCLRLADSRRKLAASEPVPFEERAKPGW